MTLVQICQVIAQAEKASSAEMDDYIAWLNAPSTQACARGVTRDLWRLGDFKPSPGGDWMESVYVGVHSGVFYTSCLAVSPGCGCCDCYFRVVNGSLEEIEPDNWPWPAHLIH